MLRYNIPVEAIAIFAGVSEEIVKKFRDRRFGND